MSEFLFDVISWLFPPFLVYLIHPIFMGMVIPSRLKRWWQIVLLAAFVSLFNLPKAIWGIYSVPANIFRIISLPVLQIAVPLLFFEGPVWKRLFDQFSYVQWPDRGRRCGCLDGHFPLRTSASKMWSHSLLAML